MQCHLHVIISQFSVNLSSLQFVESVKMAMKKIQYRKRNLADINLRYKQKIMFFSWLLMHFS